MATKFSTLIQRFVTVEQAAEVLRVPRAQLWAGMMKTVPASLAFSAAPDSAMRIDSAQNRKMTLETYQFIRNDPGINADAYLKRKVFPVFGMDTSYAAQPQPPQPPPPDPVKASVSGKGDDLNPMMPQYPGILLVLKAAGMDVTQMPPPAPVPMLGPNPGMVTPDKGMGGAEDKATGNMQGSAMKAPIAPGGQGMDNASWRHQ